MCGIAGEVSSSGQAWAPGLGERLLAVLRHRGPDDTGIFESASGQVRLLHRRLSIIDLSAAGHQPMHDPERGTVVIFNGEIYNYRELAVELKARGYASRSQSDTETILHAWAEWGEDCVSHLNGMFAFALWDESRRTLFCARDRFGEKPFYYHQRADGSLVFASEIKALFEFADVPRAADLGTLATFLATNLTDTGESTFFAGVRSLPAASTLTWSEGRTRVRRYWQIAAAPASPSRSTSDWSEALLAGLRSSIRLRMRSDVPLGTCLSGGLDSSTIVTLMREVHPGPVACFSVLYDDPELSERRFVEALVDHTAVDGHIVVPDGSDLHATLRRIVWHNDQPSSSMGQYSQWQAMKLAAEHGVTVLLNGQGGDELLAGYDRYVPTAVRALALRGRLRSAARLAAAFAAVRQGSAAVYWKQAAYPLLPAALRAAWGGHRFRPEHLAGAALDGGHGAAEPAFRSLRAHLAADLTSLSVPGLVHSEDRCSMAFSREIRLPFLDHTLVETAIDAPQDLKLRDGETKYLLRHAMLGRLTETVRQRADKKGYPTPVGRWLRTSGAAEALAVVRSPEFARRGYLDPGRVEGLLQQHVAGQADHGLLLWRCLSIEYWARAFFDTAVPPQ